MTAAAASPGPYRNVRLADRVRQGTVARRSSTTFRHFAEKGRSYVAFHVRDRKATVDKRFGKTARCDLVGQPVEIPAVVLGVAFAASLSRVEMRIRCYGSRRPLVLQERGSRPLPGSAEHRRVARSLTAMPGIRFDWGIASWVFGIRVRA